MIPSFSPRAARRILTVSLCLALGVAPAFAHGFAARGFSGRPAFMRLRVGPEAHHAGGGWDRRRWILRFGRWGHSQWGWSGPPRGWAHNEWAAWGGNNAAVFGDWGAPGWDGGVGTGAVVFAPALTIYVAPGTAPPESQSYGSAAGGCVIHQLQFDQAGKYIGERQYSEC